MWQKIKNNYHLVQALIANIYYNFPSRELTVIGVTGTDGKTTTANLIFHILKTAGLKASIVSSLGAQIGSKQFDTGFHVTTPSPFHTQKLLRKAADTGSRYFILEATSHGLEQNRLAFINFDFAVITNITSDHMDYHKTWKNYASAKARLFKGANHSILNLDDAASYDFLKNLIKGNATTYSREKNADFNLQKFKLDRFVKEEYNQSNAMAAVAVCSRLGISSRKISQAVKSFPGVSGRMQEIKTRGKFKAFIDFAHTPNALEKALRALQSQKLAGGRIIAVFGAAGDRDRQKRPEMGKVAARLTDISVITAEDPRKEDVNKISSEIESGFLGEDKKIGEDYFKIPSRSEAITFAVNTAKNGDIIALFGKGHEKSMAYGKREYVWDEATELKKALEKRQKNGR